MSPERQAVAGLRIVVDVNLCQGHGRCHAVAPDLFQLDDDGYICVEAVDVPDGSEALAERGANSCPERAIRVERRP